MLSWRGDGAGTPACGLREGMRCCGEMARSPGSAGSHGLPFLGPALPILPAHPHFTGSGTYRTQVVRDSEAVSLPQLSLQPPLIPAGIASFPYVGAGVHYFRAHTSCECSFVCSSCVHTYCTLTPDTQMPFPPWDTLFSPDSAPLPTPIHPPYLSLSIFFLLH